LEPQDNDRSEAELEESIKRKEARSRAIVLEMTGDIPDVEVKPPEEVLFVCKLNSVTTDADLELIFSRFGTIKQCEIIRDFKTGDSLNYAFIEYTSEESCIQAYEKMNNVLIDDRRIKVDFSQSVSKLWNRFLQRPRKGSTNQSSTQNKSAPLATYGGSKSLSTDTKKKESNNSQHYEKTDEKYRNQSNYQSQSTYSNRDKNYNYSGKPVHNNSNYHTNNNKNDNSLGGIEHNRREEDNRNEKYRKYSSGDSRDRNSEKGRDRNSAESTRGDRRYEYSSNISHKRPRSRSRDRYR
jgi:peptidyl-prolyl cis-trans isomerase-like 4